MDAPEVYMRPRDDRRIGRRGAVVTWRPRISRGNKLFEKLLGAVPFARKYRCDRQAIHNSRIVRILGERGLKGCRGCLSILARNLAIALGDPLFQLRLPRLGLAMLQGGSSFG